MLIVAAGFGVKVALLPGGAPLILKLTELANPWRSLTVTIKEATVPRTTLSDAGEAEIPKSGLGVAVLVGVAVVVAVAVGVAVAVAV